MQKLIKLFKALAEISESMGNIVLSRLQIPYMIFEPHLAINIQLTS